MKTLHLLADEKVSDHVIDMFETAAPGCNVYLVWSRGPDALRHIKRKGDVVCRRFRHWTHCPELRDGSSYRAVISHGMMVCFAGFIAQLPRNVPVAWCPVGSEFAKMREFRDQLPPDQCFKDTLARRYKNLVRWFRHDLRHGRLRLDDHRRKGIQRCSHVLMMTRPGFEMLRQRFNLNARHLPWAYYTAPSAANNLPPGPGILAGNAASAENEHYTLFQSLARLDRAHRKVITPLSYGTPGYRQQVLQWGRQYFGDEFHPLLDFLPLDQYRRLLAGCDIAVFNNQRLQAFGNVILLLNQGSRVFLRQNHPALNFFQQIGVRIFSIEKDLHPENPQAMQSLSDEMIAGNTHIIQKHFGRDAVIEMTRAIVRELMEMPLHV